MTSHHSQFPAILETADSPAFLGFAANHLEVRFGDRNSYVIIERSHAFPASSICFGRLMRQQRFLVLLVVATSFALFARSLCAQSADGLRRLEGKHVQIVTYLPSNPMVDELHRVFDHAVPQWCEYFSVPAQRVANWRLTAFVIRNPERFRSQGLLPNDLPIFLHGYQRDTRLWIYEQPGDYYLRHLLLHEGTHGFMHAMLGGTGAPWYNEGVSELLGTHRWSNNQLTLGVLPDSTDSFPYWGRIKIVKDEIEAARPKRLSEILRYRNTDFRELGPYGWSWAACVFFEHHPQYRDRFRQLVGKVTQDEQRFSLEFGRAFREDSAALARDWQLFQQNLDYGYNPAEDAVYDSSDAKPLTNDGVQLEIDVAKGWQSTCVFLRDGETFRIEASGRFVIANEPSEWLCEPNGITIEYHEGLPLGMLIAAVVEHTKDGSLNSNRAAEPWAPFAVGTESSSTATHSGTLFLRINEMAGRLGDNRGSVKITIKPVLGGD